jgi:hypothetical protein
MRHALLALASEMAPEEAPARIEADLLEAFRRRNARPGVSLGWIGAGLTATAALAAVFFAAPWRVEVETLPPLRIIHARPAPEWKPAPPPEVAERRLARPGARKATQRGPLRPVMDEEQEVASDFFALRPGPLVEAGEVAPLVRVRLPRTEMRRFGLPTGPEPWRSIQADIVLGQDGTARAIRFVSTGR